MARERTTRIGLVATGALALASGACSFIYATSDEQCTTDADCRTRGAALATAICSANACVTTTDPGPDASDAGALTDGDVADGPFSCALVPPPIPDPNNPVDVVMRFTDFTAGAPVTT